MSEVNIKFFIAFFNEMWYDMKCKPTNKKLWQKAKRWADKTYKVNSAYKSLGQSGWYKRNGGKWKCS